MPIDVLLGPVAALAGALVIVGVLWRAHLQSDADDRATYVRALAYRETLRQEALADQRRLVARLDKLTAALKEATHAMVASARLASRVVKSNGNGG